MFTVNSTPGLQQLLKINMSITARSTPSPLQFSVPNRHRLLQPTGKGKWTSPVPSTTSCSQYAPCTSNNCFASQGLRVYVRYFRLSPAPSSSSRLSSWRRRMECWASADTEIVDNDDDKHEEQQNTTLDVQPSVLAESPIQAHEDASLPLNPGESKNLSSITKLENFLAKNDGSLVTEGDREIKDQSTTTELDDFLAKSHRDLETQGDKQQLGEAIQIPKGIIDVLKDQVFGFDTFFITSQEPYEGGVLFKGNLRGTAAKSYEKLVKRLHDKFGEEYRLFLLLNPEDDKPVAVVVPRRTLQPDSTASAVPEWFAAGTFGLVTIFTLLLRNVPALQSNLLGTFDNIGLLNDGLPGALVTLLVLGVHEVMHFLVAKDVGVKLGIPYFIPSWQIGSFGSITRILSIVANRQDLLKLAAAGPLVGYALGLLLLLLGFILTPSDGVGIVIDPAVFHESFLTGAIAKLLLGDLLKEGSQLSINPLVLWAWAGLLINAINSIPAGELDGGRISLSLWGRKASARISSITIALLGISSLFNDVAFYWVVLIFFLQRGPVAPLAEEITEPDNKYAALGIAVLLMGLLICLPYPFSFSADTIVIDL